MDFLSDFLSAMQSYGIQSTGLVILPDDKFHRFDVDGDTKGRKNGYYRLSINNGLAIGNFGCHKRAVKENYSKRDPSGNYKFDQKEYDMRVAKQVEQDERHQLEAAQKANDEWSRAVKTTFHPYAESKGVEIIGARLLDSKLLIPLYRYGKIVGVQKISPEGEKRFTYRCSKKGAYCPIGDAGDKSLFVICEGWATGVSIHMAIKKPVVVAFDAGNLMPVAELIREKYPQAEIWIAADNDRFTPIGNVGIAKAFEAAEKIGAKVCYPDFPPELDEKRLTDWNDYATLGPIADIFFTERQKPEPKQEQRQEIGEALTDWRMRLMGGKVEINGFPFPYDGRSPLNAYLFLRHQLGLAGNIVYDEFADEVKIVACPIWDNPQIFEPRQIHESDFFMIQTSLEPYGIKLGKNVVTDALLRVAFENKVNPAKDYMESLEWDGIKRLGTWLHDYAGANKQGADYLANVGTKWMIGAVKRVFEPGCKFDTVLILEGEQGLGKSTILRELATIGGNEYFLDNVGDIRNKDTLMIMQGNLIIEMAELASFKKAENEEIKAFITRQTDVYRAPYARTISHRKRMFVFAASTNEGETDGYLTDHTGNRRYWPVQCGKMDYAGIPKVREQLWAEAVHRYKSGERTWMDESEMAGVTDEQRKRFTEDAWQDKIASIVCASSMRAEWTTYEICTELEIPARDISNVTKSRIKKSLAILGWKEVRKVDVDGTTTRKWVRA